MSFCFLENDLKMSKSDANMVRLAENVSSLFVGLNKYMIEGKDKKGKKPV